MYSDLGILSRHSAAITWFARKMISKPHIIVTFIRNRILALIYNRFMTGAGLLIRNSIILT